MFFCDRGSVVVVVVEFFVEEILILSLLLIFGAAAPKKILKPGSLFVPLEGEGEEGSLRVDTVFVEREREAFPSSATKFEVGCSNFSAAVSKKSCSGGSELGLEKFAVEILRD